MKKLSLSSFFVTTLVVAGILLGGVGIAYAAISFGSFANSDNGGTATSLTITKPSSTASGDFLVAQILFNNGSAVSSITAPSGWTLIRRTDNGTALGQALYYKFAGGSEGASYTWTFSSSIEAAGGILRYTGVDSSTPFDPIAVSGSIGTGNTGSGSSLQANQVTTGTTNTRVIAFYGLDNNDSLSAPLGMTEIYERQVNNTGGPSDLTISADDVAQAAAGATSNKTSTAGSSQVWVAQLIALRSAPDVTPPTATIDLQSGSDSGISNTDDLTNSTSPIFNVDFSEAVSGLANIDFTNIGTATGCTFSVGSVTAGDVYPVTVNGCSTSGTLVVRLVASAVTDGASLPNAQTDGPTVTLDRIAPTATLNQAVGQADPAFSAPINFTLTFSESIFGLQGTDVTPSGTTGGVKTISISTTTPTSVFNVAVTGMNSSGNLIMSFGSGQVTDAAGNSSGAAVVTDATVAYVHPSFDISVSTTGTGTVNPLGPIVNVGQGNNQSFSQFPSTGYILNDVLVDGGSVGRVQDYTFTNVLSNHTYVVNFDGGWSQPSSSSVIGSNGTVPVPANSHISDDSRTLFDNGSDVVDYGNFNLSVPAGATINGIEVAIEGNRDGTRTSDVSLSWNNSTLTASTSVGNTFTATDSTVVIGGPTNTWGRTWTASEFTNANFKVRLDTLVATNNLNIDQIQVKVFYTEDTTAPSGGSISYTDGYFTTASVPVTYSIGTDVTGIASTTGKIQRAVASLSGGVCGSFGSFSDLVTEFDGSYTDTSVTNGNCYKYQYVISDLAGTPNTATYTSANIAKVDTVKPVTTIDAAQDGNLGIINVNGGTLTNSNSIDFSFSATDAESGVASYQCKLDGGAYAPCTSPANYSGLSDGVHTVYVSAIDVAGNIELTDSVTWTVDTTIPVITMNGTSPIDVVYGVGYTDEGATANDPIYGAVAVVPSGDTVTASSPVGTYHIYYNATDAAGNPASQVTRTINVTPATATCTISGSTTTYDAAPHGASGTCVGVAAADLSSMVSLGATYTNVPGGIAHWTFHDPAGNYADQSGDVSIVINKATASVVVTPYSVTFDGNSHTAAITSITGVNGETGATVGTVDVSNTTHTNAGTYNADFWTFTGAANYNNIAATTITNTINKANATIVVTPYSVTYDGAPHTATGSATGVFAESLSGLVLTGTTHTAAADYPADAWTFTDVTGNYNNDAGTVADEITDNTAPVIAAHANVVAEATSGAGAVVTYTAPNAVDDVDGTFPATCLPASGTTFAFGPTTVHCNASDSALNAATETTFTVTVQDTTIPVITLVGSADVSVEVGTTYTDGGATASDNIDGDITGAIVTVNPVNTAVLGDYTVTYNVVDAHSNAATQVTRTVHVTDHPAPVITVESASNPTTTSIEIHWTTLTPATSRVVYGLASQANGNTSTCIAPDTTSYECYGYNTTTNDNLTLTTDHNVTVTGLTPNTQYYFRGVSHGSPETASDEVAEKTLVLPPTEGAITVTKVVSGGSKVVADFPLFVDDTSVTSGTPTQFALGAHTISETGDVDYIPTYSGDCVASPDNEARINQIADHRAKKAALLASIYATPGDPNTDARIAQVADYDAKIVVLIKTLTASVTLGANGANCTITNTYTPATGALKVHKVAVGGNGTFSFTTPLDFDITTSGGTGSHTIEVLRPDVYSVTETAQSGWEVTSNTCQDVEVVAGQTAECTITNTNTVVPPQTATISATKIVCDAESYLPNYGTGGPDITATTATDFVAASNGHCHLESGWTFEWAPSVATNPGDNVEVAGSSWTPFGVTNGSGVVTATVPAGSLVWVREQLKPNYIPFTFNTNNQTDSDPVSAEMYCNTDVLHYDNFDWVDPVVAGQTYHCVAWNVATKGTLQVKKVIVGDNAATPDQFSFTVQAGDSIMPAAAFEADGQNDLTLSPDTYTVTEVAHAGYTTTYQNCSNVVLAAGQTQMCVITNTKIVEHECDAEHHDSDEHGHDDDCDHHGDHCDNDTRDHHDEDCDNHDGEHCDFEHHDNHHDGCDENHDHCDGDNHDEDHDCDDDNDHVDVCPNLPHKQTTVPDGYHKEGDQCVKDTPPPPPSPKGTVIIQKVTVGGDASFSFTPNYGPSFVLSNGQSNNSGLLDVGNYVVVENPTEGWTQTGAVCVSSKGDLDEVLGNLHVSANETITCTVTNTKNQTPVIDENPVVHQCSDGLDNDHDNLTDFADAGCHTDGNSVNADSFNPNDDDEYNASGDSSGGNNGGSYGGGPISNGGGSLVPTVLGASTQGTVLGESCGLYMGKHLRKGSSKNDTEQVKKLQEFLVKHGFGSFGVTGYFGPLTEAAVKAFQLKYKDDVLKPWGTDEASGLVYLSTLRHINLIECPALTLQLPQLVEWSRNPKAQ